jgi:hypothetical protein
VKLARVFPRRTLATPTDDLAFFDGPDMFVPEVDAVRVSVAFTWDRPRGEQLAREWERTGLPVSIGGPAYSQRGEEFVPGRYLKPGMTITSRGCPRKCWFCRVPKVEGQLRELPIHDGWCVQDDNLLACSRPHFEAVIEMLRRQKRRAEFRGGLEALLLEDWHVDAFASLRPYPICFFAYDPGDEYETLAIAAKKMLAAGFTTRSHRLRCYVLIGWQRDTFDAAAKRLADMQALGFTPFAMAFRHPDTGHISPDWRTFQRRWARPAIIHARGH